MALIEWREEFKVGVASVDYEHEEMIALINRLHAELEAGAGQDAALTFLGEVFAKISAHFALEEQTMRARGYDQFQDHKADHERLLDDIREITDEFEQSVSLDDARLKQKLADWFQLHFKTHDSRLHNMAGMRSHEPVSNSTLKYLIQNAKNKLLHRDKPPR